MLGHGGMHRESSATSPSTQGTVDAVDAPDKKEDKTSRADADNSRLKDKLLTKMSGHCKRGCHLMSDTFRVCFRGLIGALILPSILVSTGSHLEPRDLCGNPLLPDIRLPTEPPNNQCKRLGSEVSARGAKRSMPQ